MSTIPDDLTDLQNFLKQFFYFPDYVTVDYAQMAIDILEDIESYYGDFNTCDRVCDLVLKFLNNSISGRCYECLREDMSEHAVEYEKIILKIFNNRKTKIAIVKIFQTLYCANVDIPNDVISLITRYSLK